MSHTKARVRRFGGSGITHGSGQDGLSSNFRLRPQFLNTFLHYAHGVLAREQNPIKLLKVPKRAIQGRKVLRRKYSNQGQQDWNCPGMLKGFEEVNRLRGDAGNDDSFPRKQSLVRVNQPGGSLAREFLQRPRSKAVRQLFGRGHVLPREERRFAAATFASRPVSTRRRP